MASKFGYAFIFIGMLLISLSIYIYSNTTIEAKLGAISNLILSVFDIMIFMVLGFYFTYTGYRLRRGTTKALESIQTGGQIFIFISFSLCFSFLFNLLANSKIDSTWRIFTFFLQGITRLLNPSFSIGVFIPILGLLGFVITSYWFHKTFLEKIRKNIEDN